jgi:6-phosphogluconolactonase (cycloisomerase 2 family)
MQRTHPARALIVFRIILVPLGVALIGCGGGGGNASGSNPSPVNLPVSLQAITVTAPNTSVAAGLTQQFTATGKFSDGTTKALANVTWSTSDSTVATINSAGLLNSFKQGAITVSATSGAILGNSSFTIGPPVAIGLTISPATASVVIGSADPTELSALLVFTDGSTQDVSSQAAWSSTNTSTATIDTHGNVTAIHVGYAKIGAISGTFSAAANFAVVALPRFLYVPSYVRLVSRATVDPGTGKLRFAGYVQTPSSNPTSVPIFPCPTIDPSNQFLYVASTLSVIATGANSGEIDGYAINQTTGTLTALTGGPMTFTDTVGCIQFEPTGKFGYATSSNSTTNLLLTFSRDPKAGVLTQIGSTALNNPPTGVAIDPLGTYLFTATIPDTDPPTAPAQAYGYAIDASTGALTPVPGTPFQLSNLTGGFSWHPSGNFLYMANFGGQSIDVYSVDRTTAKVSLASSITTCVNPSALVFRPDGEFAYSACTMDAAHALNSASVETFAVGSNGVLTHVASTPAPILPIGLQMDTSGKFLYLSSTGPNLCSFQIGTDGVARAGFQQGIKTNAAFSFAIIGSSNGVQYTPKIASIAAPAASAPATNLGTLSTYAVARDGTLGSTLDAISTQPSPFSLSLAPWGSNLLVGSRSFANAAYLLSPTTGIPSGPVLFGNANTKGGVIIDPSEQWAFETDAVNGTVSTFASPNWNLLSYTDSGSFITTFPAGAGAGPMAIDPAGRFLYIANQGANSISAFQYFGTSPELLDSTGHIGGSPFPIGAMPVALATDFSNPFLYVVCGDGTLRVYAMDYMSGGNITQVASLNIGGVPVSVAAAPDGQFVYAATAGAVSVFSIDYASGALKSIGSNIPVSSQILWLYAEPSGKFVYVGTVGGVLGYSINADGTLTAISSAPLATLTNPSSMSISVSIQ